MFIDSTYAVYTSTRIIGTSFIPNSQRPNPLTDVVMVVG